MAVKPKRLCGYCGSGDMKPVRAWWECGQCGARQARPDRIDIVTEDLTPGQKLTLSRARGVKESRDS